MLMNLLLLYLKQLLILLLLWIVRAPLLSKLIVVVEHLNLRSTTESTVGGLHLHCIVCNVASLRVLRIKILLVRLWVDLHGHIVFHRWLLLWPCLLVWMLLIQFRNHPDHESLIR